MVAALAATVWTWWALPALAHASLLETAPADGQTLDRAPERVTLRFDESVRAPTAGVRVFDSSGTRVDGAQVTSDGSDTVGVELAADLGDGTYVVTWRAVSDDGHLVRGAFVFSVGEGSDVSDDLLAELFESEGSRIAGGLAAVNRGLAAAAVLLAGGAGLWSVVLAKNDGGEQERARRWWRRGLIAAAVTGLAVVPFHALVTTGLGVAEALAPATLWDSMVDATGTMAILRAAVALVALAMLAARQDDRVVLVLTTAVVLSLVGEGHTRTEDPRWLLVAADSAHVLAGAIWFGGLVVLVDLLRRRRLDDDPVGAADLVARFSRMATWSLVAVVAAGSAMAVVLVRAPRALTGSTYGWTLLVKVLLVLLVILTGAYNNRQLVPAIRAARTEEVDQRARTAWDVLGRTVRLEVVGLVMVLLISGFLVNLRPAAQAAGITAPFDSTVTVTDELRLNLVVDPNRAGFNTVHLYLLDRTGRPVRDLEQVLLRFEQPEREIGPIERDPFVAGPGHWQWDGRELSIPGNWEIRVIVRPDPFQEETVTVSVAVNP